MMTRAANDVGSVLTDFNVFLAADPAPPARLAARHLTWLGARDDEGRRGRSGENPDSALTGELRLWSKAAGGEAASRDRRITCAIGSAANQTGDAGRAAEEAIVQARCGLMAVHGRDAGAPRRLGLDVASTAAGVFATQGALAALIGRDRGLPIGRVRTSMDQGGLWLLCHHLAIATCGDDFFGPPRSGPGPPFPTADGWWVELEVMTFDAWTALWRELGVPPDESEAAWPEFAYRYLTARCSLADAFHRATAGRTLAELRQVAGRFGVALCRLRSYTEILDELGGPAPREDRTGLPEGIGAPWTLTSESSARRSSSRRPPATDAPLSGLRIVEVASRLQGPLAGLLLRLLGADVIKIEPPGGDFGRHAPPLAGPFGAAYLAYNRHKEVVELDYKTPAGRSCLRELAVDADVFLHNWPPGRAEKLGLDWPDLARDNAGLVYAHASGWGPAEDGPSRLAGDFVVQAHAGCGDGLNPDGDRPFPSRLTFVDALGGLLAAEAILAGLYRRQRTHQGCRVDTSLLAGALDLQAPILEALARRRETRRWHGRPLWGPLDRPIETADGFLVVAGDESGWREPVARLCGVDPDREVDRLDREIAERFRDRPAAEWETLLRAADIPAATVQLDLKALPRSPLVAPYLERVNNACWLPATPWQFSAEVG